MSRQMEKSFEEVKFPESFKVDTNKGYSVTFWPSGTRDGDTQSYSADSWDMSKCGWEDMSVNITITITGRTDDGYECTFIENYYNYNTEAEHEYEGECEMCMNDYGHPYFYYVTSMDAELDSMAEKSLHKSFNQMVKSIRYKR